MKVELLLTNMCPRINQASQNGWQRSAKRQSVQYWLCLMCQSTADKMSLTLYLHYALMVYQNCYLNLSIFTACNTPAFFSGRKLNELACSFLNPSKTQEIHPLMLKTSVGLKKDLLLSRLQFCHYLYSLIQPHHFFRHPSIVLIDARHFCSAEIKSLFLMFLHCH